MFRKNQEKNEIETGPVTYLSIGENGGCDVFQGKPVHLRIESGNTQGNNRA
jgi:hypothetical protein